MPKARHLRNAPISEAIFDFRVKTRAGLKGEEFAPLKEQLADRFPKAEDRRVRQAFFTVRKDTAGKVAAEPAVVKDLGLEGYFLRTDDEKMMVQLRVDGFTLNRLRPYTSWEELFPEVIDLWHVYAKTAQPEVVTRLALRYINYIPLPVGNVRFEDYLTSAPVVPSELPQSVSNFLTRTTIHDQESGRAAHISQALESKPDKLAIILDIDAFYQKEFEIANCGITDAFRSLREFKNLIFFNSLTEKALEQFV